MKPLSERVQGLRQNDIRSVTLMIRESGGINLGFREDEAAGGSKLFGAETFDIVALDDAERAEAIEMKAYLEVVEEGAGFGGELGLFLDK